LKHRQHADYQKDDRVSALQAVLLAGPAEIADGPLSASDSAMDAIYAALVNQNASISSPDEVKTWVAGRCSYIKGQLYSVTNTALDITPGIPASAVI
jgi:hypothetical protein